MSASTILRHWSAKIDRDLAYLGDCFREVLEELGESGLATCVPWGSGSDTPTCANIGEDRVLQVLSIAFQLLNIVEESAAASVRREQEHSGGQRQEPGLWAHQLAELHRCGYSPEELAGALQAIDVEVVLTAHPTEAKRPAVLRQHRAIFDCMRQLDNPALAGSERAVVRNDIKSALERLWRTGEMYLRKPTVASELAHVVHFLREVFPRALPRLEQRLTSGWEAAGLDPALLANATRPRLTFGTWVGGDRDGHPLVTAEVTATTFERLHTIAVDSLRQQLDDLQENLTLSEMFQEPPTFLREAVQARAERIGEQAAALLERAPREPWQQFVLLMMACLPGATHDAVYTGPEEVLEDLALLKQALHHVGADRLAASDLAPVRRHLRAFGFHAAALDIRQNSGFYEKALAELFDAANLDGDGYLAADAAGRASLLDAELQSLRPIAPRGATLGEHAQPVVDCFATVAAQVQRHGPRGVGSFIVSMTRSAADLLVVYLFAREVGLLRQEGDQVVCDVPVVPLFETVDDLRRSPAILDAFLNHPITQASLRRRHRQRQQVMVGYSDSNKDSGLLAAHWNLHRAQRSMTEAANDHGVELQFFHGRGGTFSRGAGPTHRFLEALAHGSLSGSLRLTEQGETIAQKYGHLPTAVYNLELLLAGVTATTLKHRLPREDDPRVVRLLDRLSALCADAYRDLLAAPGFLAFWRQATPIDVLERSFIGSRPARRTGKATFDDLRAIPWVFSWSQARFYLPGWFGIGAGLEALREEDPDAFDLLRERVHDIPFTRWVLYNAETSLTSSSLELMQAYAGLVEDGAVRDEFLRRIFEERERTDAIVDTVMGAPRGERRPRMMKTVHLRDDGLRVLHLRQIDLLRVWRKRLASDDADGANRLMPSLLLSINAIASGLRATG